MIIYIENTTSFVATGYLLIKSKMGTKQIFAVHNTNKINDEKEVYCLPYVLVMKNLLIFMKYFVSSKLYKSYLFTILFQFIFS